MAKVLTEKKNYEDIANAIRAKGVSGTFKPGEMANAISQISGGIQPTGNINITNTNVIDVTDYATAQFVDDNLKPENIAKDVSILGIVGTHEGGGGGSIQLDRIELITPPTKTIYTVGETFDTSGITIRAVYTNGASRMISNYSFEPSGELKVDDSVVTISFNEFGITKTIDVDIVVYGDQMYNHSVLFKRNGQSYTITINITSNNPNEYEFKDVHNWLISNGYDVATYPANGYYAGYEIGFVRALSDGRIVGFRNNGTLVTYMVETNFTVTDTVTPL